MKFWLRALVTAIYETRAKILSLFAVCAGWLIVASIVETYIGREILDVFAYGILGWYWLGGVVHPWVEKKLEQLFDY